MLDEELKTINKAYQLVMEFMVNYSFQVVGALIILILGFIAASMISRGLGRLLERRQVDVTLRGFVVSVVRTLILACFIIISLGKFGITIAPFVAALGAAAFGVGMALQGPIANYGAGLSIILSRPFKVGDTVTMNSVSGIVEEIKLANTTLRTEDGEVITIPNKLVIGVIIQNSYQHKIVESVIGIDYQDSPELAVKVILDALSGIGDVAMEPKPQVGIDSFGDFSINIGLRFWVPMEKYFEARYRANQAVFTALKSAGITIPYPRREVFFLNQK
jgi:small conductance mechanosensitive channel